MAKTLTLNEQTQIRLIESEHDKQLFQLIDSNREHLRSWHPWVNTLRSTADVEKSITGWQQRYANGTGCYNGIWFNGQLCGMINYVSVDWSNQWAALSYWLDADHQGQGIMTSCCEMMIAQAFDAWKFNRISIECAAENTRSRAIPERLGFKFEGIIRAVEWLHDHYVDHAMYGLLRSEYTSDPKLGFIDVSPDLPWSNRSGSTSQTPK